jgi:Leu/Phe-tRNA-protein transferase
MVLFPEEFRLTRSLRKTLRAGKFAVRFDTDFPGVMDACATTPPMSRRSACWPRSPGVSAVMAMPKSC